MSRADIPLEELLPVLLDALQEGGEFEILPRGESMLPLIRPGRDSVRLVAPKTLKKRDICLYRRADGRFVLHRLEGVAKDGTLIFRGDNQREKEYGISKEAVIARVCAIIKDGKQCAPAPFFYCLTHVSALARRFRFPK